MRLREIHFRNSFIASGGVNFYGEGWKQHRFFRLFSGFNYKKATPIMKTSTIEKRMPEPEDRGKGKGNLVINWHNLQTSSFFPDCVRIDFFRDRMANSVSLSNPGFKNLLNRNIWQNLVYNFVLSYMPVKSTKEERLKETRKYTNLLKARLASFSAIIAQEFNVSCPNNPHLSDEFYGEIIEHLEILHEIGIPIIIKFDNMVSVDFMKKIEISGLCDGFDIPNSLGINKKADRIDWEKLRYLTDSIVEKYGTCGYSGRENFDLAVKKIEEARQVGITLPIIGGGVSSKKDVHTIKKVGADAISIGRALNTRFWRVKGIINEAEKIFGGEK